MYYVKYDKKFCILLLKTAIFQGEKECLHKPQYIGRICGKVRYFSIFCGISQSIYMRLMTEIDYKGVINLKFYLIITSLLW